MPKWIVEGFDGGDPTGFSRQVTGGEAKVQLLLQRLAVRHLTEDEIVEATFGERTDLFVHRDKQLGQPTMLTIGSGYHYIAVTTQTGRPARNIRQG
jgi:hypothetical protein